MNPRRALALVAVAVCLLGCDPSHALAIKNETQQSFVVRVTETTYAKDYGNEVHYFDVGPASFAYLFAPSTGPLEGKVEVLDTACKLVADIPARSGSVVTIRSDLALDIRYLAAGDDPVSPTESVHCR